MQENSPYTAPESDITTQNTDETYQPRFFATKGRIGRLRYLAYMLGVYAVLAIGVGILAAAGMDLTEGVDTNLTMLPMVAMVLMYIALFVFGMILAKRRLNDLDMTSWLLLVLLIPIVGALFGIYMVFASGTDGSNKYGPKPCKNSIGVKIIGLAFPAIFVIGILAAIALPAYQEYVARAAGV